MGKRLFVSKFTQQANYCNNNTGYDKNTEIAGTHDGQGFHQKICTHDFNLQSVP